MSYNLWEHFTKIYKIKLSKFVITSLEFIREYIKDYVSSKATVKATLLPPDHCRGQKRRLTEKVKITRAALENLRGASQYESCRLQ